MNTDAQPQIVLAPQTGASDSSGQIISVELQPDEEVVWQWIHYPNGQSAVTGYEIIRKK
jgi:hypothetical protein